MKRSRALSRLSVVVVAAGALALAGCGSGDDDAGGPPLPAAGTVTVPPEPALQTLDISADAAGQLRFEPRRLTAEAGRVAILMTNPPGSGKSHGVGITGADLNVQGLTVKPGELSEASGDVTPGSYNFYCTVPRHAKAGMRGTLVVR